MPTARGSIFINPSSGARFGAAERSQLVSASRQAGLEVIDFGRKVDVGALVRERIPRGQTLFIAAGGDGTIHTLVQPIINTEAVLGVVPIGTYNHFARDLGIPLDWRAALDVALSGAERQIDAGRVNDRFFVNNIAIGLYPEMVVHRERHGRNNPRWRARLDAAVATLWKYPHVALTVEADYLQEILRTHVFMVSNNSYDLSGIGIEASRATLEEGRLGVYWLPHIPRIALMRFLASYLAGRVTQAPGFRSFRTARVKVQSPRRHLHLGIDGEVFTMAPPLVITSVPSALLVRSPR